jgi:hypothetical protein
VIDRDYLSAGLAYRPPVARMRNLGLEIFLLAIQDYRGLNSCAHRDAKALLYPRTAKRQDHYDWVAGLTDGLNPAWLRDALDRFQSQWDEERSQRKARHRGKTSLPKGKRNAANTSRVDEMSVSSAHAPSNVWHDDAAARL